MNCKTEKFPRSNKGFQSVASCFSETAKKLFGKNGFIEIDIIKNWNEIVGKNLAEHSNPQSIDFKKGQRNNGILNIIVESGAFALEFSHKKKNIIEKINTYFGYNAVSDLRILQTNSGDFSSQNPQLTGVKKNVVTLEEQNYIVAQTANIEDTQLKMTLQKLGNNIIVRNSKK